jgi:hypothetical protein
MGIKQLADRLDVVLNNYPRFKPWAWLIILYLSGLFTVTFLAYGIRLMMGAH